MKCSGVSSLPPVDSIGESMAEDRKGLRGRVPDGFQRFVPGKVQNLGAEENRRQIVIDAQVSQAARAVDLFERPPKLRDESVDRQMFDGKIAD